MQKCSLDSHLDSHFFLDNQTQFGTAKTSGANFVRRQAAVPSDVVLGSNLVREQRPRLDEDEALNVRTDAESGTEGGSADDMPAMEQIKP